MNGYIGKNSPRERRTFFDLERRIAELEAASSKPPFTVLWDYEANPNTSCPNGANTLISTSPDFVVDSTSTILATHFAGLSSGGNAAAYAELWLEPVSVGATPVQISEARFHNHGVGNDASTVGKTAMWTIVAGTYRFKHYMNVDGGGLTCSLRHHNITAYRLGAP